MTLHRVLGGRLLAVAFLQHLILQTAGGGDDAFLLGVLLQIFLAFFLGSLTLLGTCGIHGSLFLGEIVLHNLLCLTMRHLQLAAAQHVLD